MAFASYNSGTQKAKGAGVDFGAVALGLIEGNNSGSGEPYGFASGTTGYNRTSFANQSTISATNYWGGFLEGTVRQTHCIPDYFGTKQSSPSSISSAGDVSALGSGQYIATPGGILNVGAGSPIAAGKRITLFVSGDVFIGSNITYASRSTYTADNPPKFALVVKGNIYISPSVGALDGLYIAQPGANPSTSGFIWTCHNNDTLEPNNIFVSSSCRSKLTVNGAFIAKKLQLLRANGDQAASVADEPASSGNIAEVFNFTPEMVVGGGFFNQPGATSNKIQSLISLPPVF